MAYRMGDPVHSTDKCPKPDCDRLLINGAPCTCTWRADDSTPPRGAVIEIIEKGRATDDTTGGSVIAPNDVRINGQSLAASADDPVIVHEMSTRSDELVRVTLTLFARRVSIRAEHDD